MQDMGSNPIPCMESSVRVKTKNTEKAIRSRIVNNNRQSIYEMRDIYNRKTKLEHWMQRIDKELYYNESDKKDILKFVNHLQEKDKSILWIVRCITALLQLRRQLNKPFSEVTKDDIKKLFDWMNDKGYKASTHEKYRVILKTFYKIVYGNNEEYPDCVKWFSVSVGKDIKSKEKGLDIAEYLEENEVSLLIDAAPTIQKKAFLAIFYETGCRPEEGLRLTNLDIKLDTNGAISILRGKTGERRVRIVSFTKLLQQWLDIHPLKSQKQFPLWISQATNYKNEPLGLRGAQKIIEEALLKANLDKHRRLYLLRHSRATHLCKYFTEAQMCIFFGWAIGTKVVRRYIHLSGKDLDNTLLSISQGRQIAQEDYQLKTIKCNICSEILSPTQRYCSRCGLSCDLSQQYSLENKIMKENNELKQQMQTMKKEMETKFQQILEKIEINRLVRI
jgi:integrase/recombinase XerD